MEAKAVEGPPDIRRIADGDDALRAEGHFLAAEPQDRGEAGARHGRQADIDEGLLQVELVLVGRGGEVLAEGEVAAELGEGAETVADVKVCIDQEALQEIAVGRCAEQGEVRRRVIPKRSCSSPPTLR